MTKNQRNERELMIEDLQKFWSNIKLTITSTTINVWELLYIADVLYFCFFWGLGSFEFTEVKETSSGTLITLSLLPILFHFITPLFLISPEMKSKYINIFFAVIRQIYVIICFSAFVTMAILTLYYAITIDWKQYNASGWPMWYNFVYTTLLSILSGLCGTLFNIVTTAESLKIDLGEKFKKCIFKCCKSKEFAELIDVENQSDEQSVIMLNIQMNTNSDTSNSNESNNDFNNETTVEITNEIQQ